MLLTHSQFSIFDRDHCAPSCPFVSMKVVTRLEPAHITVIRVQVGGLFGKSSGRGAWTTYAGGIRRLVWLTREVLVRVRALRRFNYDSGSFTKAVISLERFSDRFVDTLATMDRAYAA